MCHYLTKTQIHFMTYISYVKRLLLFAVFLPNVLCAQVRREEKVVFDFTCGTITNETKAINPSNRGRLKLGIGEEVTLKIEPASVCLV